MPHRGLEKVRGPLDVDAGIVCRLLDRRPHPRHGGQMQDRSRLGAGDQHVDGVAIGDVDHLHVDRFPATDGLQVHFLPRAVVEVAEVIDGHDVEAEVNEGLGGVRADEPGPAGNENGFTLHVLPRAQNRTRVPT